MHESTKRLFEVAASDPWRIKGPSALAFAMQESPQVINAWKQRGVSVGGALMAEMVFGISPNYILNGIRPARPYHSGTVIALESREPLPVPYSIWPFKTVELQRVLSLAPADQVFIEKALAAAVENVESRTSASKEQSA
jgi:hypothetical protein